MWRDLSYAARTLARSPLFTAVAVLSLALGIGATTAIFSFMDQVILRTLPVREPERLVLFHREYQPNGSSTSDGFESVFSNPMLRELARRDPAFQQVAARSGARVALTYNGETKSTAAEIVSGNFFELAGVGAAIGRVLTPQDDEKPGAHPVIVLGHSYWTSRFGGNRAILNQTVAVNGHPMTVIGVAAAGFNGLRPGSTPDFYVSIAMQKAMKPTWDALNDPQFRWLNIFARMKPGFNVKQAQAATDVAYRSILEAELAQNPQAAGKRERDQFLNHRVELRNAAQGISSMRREWEKPLEAVMAMVAFVLLIACANVAGLMLARSAARQREISIRLALGASRFALVKQLLIEALLLAAAAGALGLAGAYWTAAALIRVLPPDYFDNWLSASIDLRVLGFNILLCALCTLLFGLAPALQATRPDIADTLKEKSAQGSYAGRAARLRKLMVTAQVAFSLVLLVGAGLFSQSLYRMLKVQLGFRTEQLMMFNVDATPTRPEIARAVTFYRELQDRLVTAGGVVSAGASNTGPFSNSDQAGNITVEGYRAGENEYTGAQFSAVSPGFFAALGIPLRAGREITARDEGGAPKVIVVNEAFAKHYFGTSNPIGRRLMFGSGNKRTFDREIVGLVADSRKGVRTIPEPCIYFPYAQWDQPERLTFYVRTAGDAGRLGTDLRQIVRSLDPGVPLGDLQSMTVQIRNSIYTERMVAILSAAFGVLATLLAAIGLYGVIGYTVTRRTPEIGIRMALGALPLDVVKMVLGEAGRMVAAGTVIGIVGAVALGRLVESQLFGIKAGDPVLITAAVVLLSLVTVAAAFAPAWRASRINPVSALKYE